MRNNKGFTLIELSIVVVIIGLIVAGVVAGQSLVRQAKLRSTVSDAETIQAALNAFFLQYNALPGDIPNATSYWSGTGNGDNNKWIEFNVDSAGTGSSEVGRVFQHLGLANLYPGSFVAANVLATTGSNGVPEMAPDGPWSNSKYIVTNYTQQTITPVGRNQLGGTSVNVIRLGGISVSINPHIHTFIGNGLLTIPEAISIDDKIDDGLARSGSFTGHNELVTGQNNAVGCLEFGGPATSDATGAANYNLGADFLCNISFNTMW